MDCGISDTVRIQGIPDTIEILFDRCKLILDPGLA